jgi:hypothetical protein
MIPDQHLAMATDAGLRFYATVKQRRGGRWEKVVRDVALDEAYQRATAESAFERAVFVHTPVGGFMYWTSRFPDTFNSDALTHAISERTKTS